MKDEHMEAQHDTDGGHDRAARRRELKRAFHKAAATYFKVRVVWRDRRDFSVMLLPAGRDAEAAYEAWKDAH